MSRISEWLVRVPRWSSVFVNPRHLLRWLLALDDTAQNIALGTAIGVGIGLTPTFGIQMLLVLLIAPFVQFNKMVALVMVYISNPLTMLPLAYMNYRVGALFFDERVTYAEFASVFGPNWQQGIGELFSDAALPVLVGSVIVAVAGGLIAYPCTLWLVQRLRPAVPELSGQEAR